MRQRKLPITLFTVIVALLFQTKAFALDTYYGNFQLALADLDGFNDDGIALIGTLGIPIPDVHQNFAAEFELSFPIVKPEFQRFGVTAEANYVALGAFGMFNVYLSELLSLRPRAGLVFVDYSFDSAFAGSDDSDLELAFGVGFQFDTSENVDVLFELTFIDDLTHIGGGVQIEF